MNPREWQGVKGLRGSMTPVDQCGIELRHRPAPDSNLLLTEISPEQLAIYNTAARDQDGGFYSIFAHSIPVVSYAIERLLNIRFVYAMGSCTTG